MYNIHSNEQKKVGKLKIFFGYAAGVGKTYAMLDEAQEQLKRGIDIVVGYVEPHTPPETIQLLSGLPTLPPKVVSIKNVHIKEFDLEAALKRKPELILIDELEHSNIEGVRNKKRFQDVEELLNAGIDVYTTVNVQHVESFNDIIHKITKVNVKETFPDYIFDDADEVRLVDIEPDELLLRLREGKIYCPERSKTTVENFLSDENISLLRELATRKALERINHNNRNEKHLSEKMAGIKYLACISASPSSLKCIRWTARTAEVFHVPWVAVYVENMDSQYLSENEKKDIRANMELAERLGAEIVTLNGHDVATVVAEFAKLYGITNIVVGKSGNKKPIARFFKQSLENRLISLLPSIEIHIIPGDVVQTSGLTHKQIMIRKNLLLSWGDTFKTLGLLTAATLFCMLLQDLNVGNQNIIMVYILSVLIVSRITMGYIYSVADSILSVLAFNYFFTVPYYTFNAIQPGYPITFFIMFLVALITSTLTIRVRMQARLAVERERRTDVLYEISKKLLATRGLENIVDLTNEYITRLFDRSTIFFTQDPAIVANGVLMQSSEDTDASFLISDNERAAAHWVFVNQKDAGAGTDTLNSAKAFYMPVASQGNALGVIGLSCARGKLSQSSRLFLHMLTSQVAMALERQYLSDEQRRILIEAEKEKMRSNLLRAISHDLRTPLTGILGASSAILENGDLLDKQTQGKLVADIKEDSQWLIRMVENLLSVTRISEGTMNVAKTPEAAEEIVAEAISRIRKKFKESRINVKVPEELLLVPMDGTLIEQVIINLVENAIKHSGEDTLIDVNVKKEKNHAVFEVSDKGEGIPEQDFPYLFESYVSNGRKSSDSSRGMGIGLSICKSIIKAHNGEIRAANKKDGGAVFEFTLPLEEGENDE